ncbi:cytochrome P450 [Xylariomycetidae sp. FL0641]|nr:cytochrome P450 [Xylariomycetidae sp. FL0641]
MHKTTEQLSYLSSNLASKVMGYADQYLTRLGNDSQGVDDIPDFTVVQTTAGLSHSYSPSLSSKVRGYAGYVALIGLLLFFVRLFQVRMKFRRLVTEHGIPLMPHSFLLGHLWVMAKLNMKYKIPRDAHAQWMMHFLQKEYPDICDHGLIYMDVWPIGYPMLAVFQPEMCHQFTAETSLPKFWAQGHKQFKHFTKGQDLLHLEGQEWKQTRALFNPGFSAKNLLSLVPQFVEEALVFREKLRTAAVSRDVVKLEDYTTDLTMDVVGRAILGTRLQVQTKPSKLMKTIQKQVSLCTLTVNLPVDLSPTRHIKHWFYNRTIRAELMPYILGQVNNAQKTKGPKTVLALATKAVSNENSNDGASRDHSSIPPAFIERTVQHIKIFMFAGHDTTAITLAYAYYMLSLNADALARLRAEHDEVLGTATGEAASRISEDPTLLNRLPYTAAVMKETLRLFSPVGGTIRQSPAGHVLRHPETGKAYPTHGFMLHGSGATMGRMEAYWPRAERFLPERFLVRDPTHPLYPRRNAWRPFEFGPRACIGQELFNLEVRLILALTVREFDFAAAYDEGADEMFGLQGYPHESAGIQATAHVKDALPMRIALRQKP